MQEPNPEPDCDYAVVNALSALARYAERYAQGELHERDFETAAAWFEVAASANPFLAKVVACPMNLPDAARTSLRRGFRLAAPDDADES